MVSVIVPDETVAAPDVVAVSAGAGVRVIAATVTNGSAFAPSNASFRPTGKCSTDSFLPRAEWQKMHVEYTNRI